MGVVGGTLPRAPQFDLQSPFKAKPFHLQAQIAALQEELREFEAVHASRSLEATRLQDRLTEVAAERSKEAARLQASLTKASAAHSTELRAERHSSSLALEKAIAPLHASIAELRAEAERARVRASREALLRRKVAAAAAAAAAAVAAAGDVETVPSQRVMVTYEGDSPAWVFRHVQHAVQEVGLWGATAPPLHRAAAALMAVLPLLAMLLLSCLPGWRVRAAAEKVCLPHGTLDRVSVNPQVSNHEVGQRLV